MQPLMAQNIDLQATFESTKLSGGFSPDPMKYDVVSGG
jgi:hypothetical protein